MPTHQVPRDTTTALAVESLHAAPLFWRVPAETLQSLASLSRMATYRRGERIWAYGEVPTYVGVVASGRVKCWSGGRADREWITLVARAGDTCGLAACVDGGPYTSHATSIERSRIVLVPRDAILHLMDTDRGFERAVAIELAGTVRRLARTCEDMALHKPIERVAYFLSTRTGHDGLAELDQTHAEIAGELGTVREVIGRALRELETRGLIARSGTLIRVLRPVELAALGRR